MTVSSGFFNSVNHDRLYDATQLSSIFDGIIKDGVYQGIGEAFKVIGHSELNNTVVVGTGRAWFDHIWTLNDSDFSITLNSPNEMLSRIDAIVIDVNREESVRKSSIISVQGNMSSGTPSKPELIKTDLHNQYPLAYITINAGNDRVISNSDIEIAVGSNECPLVTGVLEVLTKDLFIQQFEAQFNEWFDGLKDLVDEDLALQLQSEIEEINSRLNESQSSSLTKAQIDFARDPKIQRTKISTIGTGNEATTRRTDVVVLPDQYVAVVHMGGATSISSSATDTQSLYASILDKNNLATSTKLITLRTSPYPYAGLALCFADCDNYPVNLYYTIGDKQQTSSGTNETRHCLLMIKVTISAQHVVSVTTNYDTSLAFAESTSSMPYDEPTSSILPAYDVSGNAIVGVGIQYSTSYYYLGFYKITPNWVVSTRKASRLSVSRTPNLYTGVGCMLNDGTYYFDLACNPGDSRSCYYYILNSDLSIATKYSDLKNCPTISDIKTGWNDCTVVVGNQLVTYKNTVKESIQNLPFSIDGSFYSDISSRYENDRNTFYPSLLAYIPLFKNSKVLLKIFYVNIDSTSQNPYRFYTYGMKDENDLVIFSDAWSDSETYEVTINKHDNDSYRMLHPYLESYDSSTGDFVSVLFPKIGYNLYEKSSITRFDDRPIIGIDTDSAFYIFRNKEE